jgi:hypothetical protein
MFDDGTDTYSYKGWLTSDHFLKRAFAVFGYYIVAALLFWFCLFAIFMLFAIMAGIVFGTY